jgi:hypothetical protein
VSADIDYAALGRRGALALASKTDMHKVAAHARASSPSSVSYFWPQVDPDGTLDPEDRDRRAKAAQRLFFLKMAQKREAAKKAARNGNGAR